MSCVKRGQDQKGRVHVAYSCEGVKKKKKKYYIRTVIRKKTGLLVNKESDLFVSLLVYLYTVLLRNVCVAFLF